MNDENKKDKMGDTSTAGVAAPSSPSSKKNYLEKLFSFLERKETIRGTKMSCGILGSIFLGAIVMLLIVVFWPPAAERLVNPFITRQVREAVVQTISFLPTTTSCLPCATIPALSETPIVMEPTIGITPPTPTSSGPMYPIVITEVRTSSCNDFRRVEKQYVEIYNYGQEKITVKDWWIAANADLAGTPDKIVKWSERHPNENSPFGEGVLTDTTEIESGKFGVIFSPFYNRFSGLYKFPEGTVILTVSEGYLGNDSTGLRGMKDDELDTLVLYSGTDKTFDDVISTYGTPIFGTSPKSIEDDNKDGIPFAADECYAIEMIDPFKENLDTASNWRQVENGTPGEGYKNP